MGKYFTEILDYYNDNDIRFDTVVLEPLLINEKGDLVNTHIVCPYLI